MKESREEDLASHLDPESYAASREAVGEALTGAHTGQVSSCEITSSGVPTLLTEAEGHIEEGIIGESSWNSTQSEALSMWENSLRGNREISSSSVEDGSSDRSGKGITHNPDMYGLEKSDDGVVPEKSSNKGRRPAETMEGRLSTSGNLLQKVAFPTQSGANASSGMQRVREVARKDKKVKFTALLHHVTIPLMIQSFKTLQKDAAPGNDGVTWKEYEIGLTHRIEDLHRRIHTGSYRAVPVRRTHIPKADGGMRALGIAALEDKVVQRAIVTVLSEIWEADFVGFSYGFRPKRSAHDALDALHVGIMGKKVNWVLDADIRGFFDTIDHEWLLKFVEHRVADPRILRLIQKWLKAGVSEDGRWSETKMGTPQGAVVSPLLANLYLHYVFDLWVHQWRQKHAYGDVIVIRYADDFALGFQYRREAERFLFDLKARFQKFGLELHPEKTRLIEFGRFAGEDRQKRGQGKPETFEFLGFTHCCGVKRLSRTFLVKRKTAKKRMRVRLQRVKEVLSKRRHEPIPEQASWLRQVLAGYYQYHAIPGNMPALQSFHTQVVRIWYKSLRRRSQRNRLIWERFGPLANRLLASPKILHPSPNERFYAKHPK
ncbi:group II intron reverse transcriptase/maturase [Telmatocola sphagniphila]